MDTMTAINRNANLGAFPVGRITSDQLLTLAHLMQGVASGRITDVSDEVLMRFEFTRPAAMLVHSVLSHECTQGAANDLARRCLARFPQATMVEDAAKRTFARQAAQSIIKHTEPDGTVRYGVFKVEYDATSRKWTVKTKRVARLWTLNLLEAVEKAAVQASEVVGVIVTPSAVLAALPAYAIG